MSDGTRFALGIAILLGAMIGFFFAFHPGGVQLTEQNPAGILKWVMQEVTNSGANSPTAPASSGGPQNAGASPAAGGA